MRMWAVIAGWAGMMALAVSLYWLGMTREGSNPPDSHGYTLIVVAIVLGIVAMITLLADVAWNTRHPIAAYLSVRRLRWPVFNTSIPNPDQWLLDIATDNASNPEKYLFAWNQILRGMDLAPETLRPWIDVGISIRNGGVCDMLVGPCQGHGSYQGKELPDAIEQDGISRLPPSQTDEIRLKQYVPREMAQTIFEERRNRGRIRLGIGQVDVMIRAECPGAEAKKWRIQGAGFFRADD